MIIILHRVIMIIHSPVLYPLHLLHFCHCCVQTLQGLLLVGNGSFNSVRFTLKCTCKIRFVNCALKNMYNLHSIMLRFSCFGNIYDSLGFWFFPTGSLIQHEYLWWIIKTKLPFNVPQLPSLYRTALPNNKWYLLIYRCLFLLNMQNEMM